MMPWWAWLATGALSGAALTFGGFAWMLSRSLPR